MRERIEQQRSRASGFKLHNQSEPTVDDKCLSGDVSQGGEAHASVGDVVRSRSPVERCNRSDTLLQRIPRLGPRRLDEPGGDRIYPDGITCILGKAW